MTRALSIVRGEIAYRRCAHRKVKLPPLSTSSCSHAPHFTMKAYNLAGKFEEA